MLIDLIKVLDACICEGDLGHYFSPVNRWKGWTKFH